MALLGNTNVLISDGHHSILVDGFFTRACLLRSILGKAPSLEEIKKALAIANVPDALDAIIVSHSHFDHAMDAPLVATLTDADLIGSSSTKWIAAGFNQYRNRPVDFNIAEKFQLISEKGGSWSNDTFEVKLYAGEHGPAAFKWAAKLLGGLIEKPIKPPASLVKYKEGEVVHRVDQTSSLRKEVSRSTHQQQLRIHLIMSRPTLYFLG